MPLSWNEIKDRALRFSREWAGPFTPRTRPIPESSTLHKTG